MADYQQRIVLDPAVRSGNSIVKGTRIAVADILDYFAGGMAIGDILADFPDVREDHMPAACAFAADRERHLLARS